MGFVSVIFRDLENTEYKANTKNRRRDDLEIDQLGLERARRARGDES